MNKSIVFRLVLDVKTTIKVDEVKDTDYGKERYLKQVIKEFVKNQDALLSIIMINFIDSYCSDLQEKLEPILGNQEDEKPIILRVAKKCTPETFHYFSDLFANRPVLKMKRGDESEKIGSTAETGKEQEPEAEVDESELIKNMESEWVFGELMRRLCRFIPVHATFNELPQEKMTRPLKHEKPVSKKARIDRKYNIPNTTYQPTTSPSLHTTGA